MTLLHSAMPTSGHHWTTAMLSGIPALKRPVPNLRDYKTMLGK